MVDEKFPATDTQRQVEHNQVNVHLVRLTTLSSDPVTADLKDGDLWNTNGVLKFRSGGVTKTVTLV